LTTGTLQHVPDVCDVAGFVALIKSFLNLFRQEQEMKVAALSPHFQALLLQQANRL
jgi:hypothetical protein